MYTNLYIYIKKNIIYIKVITLPIILSTSKDFSIFDQNFGQ